MLIHVGVHILDLSKLLMYEFYFDYIKKSMMFIKLLVGIKNLLLVIIQLSQNIMMIETN